MKVCVEEAGPCRKRLNIEIPADRVDDEYTQVLKAYTKAAKLPGFRPGRAPKDLVKRRYGDKIVQEVKERLIPYGYQQALAQEQIKAIAVLDVEDKNIELGQAYSFQLTLDVPPEFEMPVYKSLFLKRYRTDVHEEEIDEAIAKILEAKATYEDIHDRAAERGDLVQINYEGVMEGQPINAITPHAKEWAEGEEFWCRTDEDSFIPGLAEQLIGRSAGERQQVLVDFPEDCRETLLASKKATYFVEVRGIREKKLPNLDEEFLRTMGVSSVEEFRKRVADDLETVKQNKEDQRLKTELVKSLLERTTMELPSSVVDHETKNTVYNIVRENSMRGVPQQEIEESKGEILEAASKNAKDKVKIHYIIHRIAEDEGLEISEDELSMRVKTMALQYQTTEREMVAALEEKKMMNSVKQDLLREKTLDWLMNVAKIEDVDAPKPKD